MALGHRFRALVVPRCGRERCNARKRGANFNRDGLKFREKVLARFQRFFRDLSRSGTDSSAASAASAQLRNSWLPAANREARPAARSRFGKSVREDGMRTQKRGKRSLHKIDGKRAASLPSPSPFRWHRDRRDRECGFRYRRAIKTRLNIHRDD